MDWPAAVNGWLHDTRANNIRPRNTAELYERALRKFAAWYVGTTGWQPAQPAAVTRADLLDYRALLQTSGLAPATCNTYMKAIRAFFHWCNEHDVIRVDPTRAIRDVPKEADVPRHLVRNQYNQLKRHLQQ